MNGCVLFGNQCVIYLFLEAAKNPQTMKNEAHATTFLIKGFSQYTSVALKKLKARINKSVAI